MFQNTCVCKFDVLHPSNTKITVIFLHVFIIFSCLRSRNFMYFWRFCNIIIICMFIHGRSRVQRNWKKKSNRQKACQRNLNHYRISYYMVLGPPSERKPVYEWTNFSWFWMDPAGDICILWGSYKEWAISSNLENAKKSKIFHLKKNLFCKKIFFFF